MTLKLENTSSLRHQAFKTKKNNNCRRRRHHHHHQQHHQHHPSSKLKQTKKIQKFTSNSGEKKDNIITPNSQPGGAPPLISWFKKTIVPIDLSTVNIHKLNIYWTYKPYPLVNVYTTMERSTMLLAG